MAHSLCVRNFVLVWFIDYLFYILFCALHLVYEYFIQNFDVQTEQTFTILYKHSEPDLL